MASENNMRRATVLLHSIKTWTSYFIDNSLKNTFMGHNENLYKIKPELNEKISLWSGDISTLGVAAVVSPANAGPTNEGEVSKTIEAGAGQKLREMLSSFTDGCPEGEAIITPGFDLPAKNIIHTACGSNLKSLSNCYRSVLQLALERDIKSIAFPCISTGVGGGIPQEEAAHTALREVRDFLNDHHTKIERIVFSAHLETDRLIYEQLLQRYFPVKETTVKPLKQPSNINKREPVDLQKVLSQYQINGDQPTAKNSNL